MQIRNFKSIRINSENLLDVSGFGGHSDYGVLVTAYDFASAVIEVRRKEGTTAMLAMQYDDLDLPAYWKDAEILFTTRLAANTEEL
ncbi:hypothetical protein GJU41_11880 [Bacillus idriensis]|uniref:Uncharacterized protein n=1 Tax=Metabacillus idriensis TaxID=324768 RepID=A0A6I2MBK7_9BACI|nr:hypothetical protein [Metabacillus idriensis]MRX54672.1 hypothetical protein [Metabacillus idriensis]